VECGDRFCPVVITVLFLGLSIWSVSTMKTVRVYIDDVFHCTILDKDVEGMLRHLKSVGIVNVTVR
jgi:uncharacterized protein Smg (DUF494 family)